MHRVLERLGFHNQDGVRCAAFTLTMTVTNHRGFKNINVNLREENQMNYQSMNSLGNNPSEVDKANLDKMLDQLISKVRADAFNQGYIEGSKTIHLSTNADTEYWAGFNECRRQMNEAAQKERLESEFKHQKAINREIEYAYEKGVEVGRTSPSQHTVNLEVYDRGFADGRMGRKHRFNQDFPNKL